MLVDRITDIIIGYDCMQVWTYKDIKKLKKWVAESVNPGGSNLRELQYILIDIYKDIDDNDDNNEMLNILDELELINGHNGCDLLYEYDVINSADLKDYVMHIDDSTQTGNNLLLKGEVLKGLDDILSYMFDKGIVKAAE